MDKMKPIPTITDSKNTPPNKTFSRKTKVAATPTSTPSGSTFSKITKPKIIIRKHHTRGLQYIRSTKVSFKNINTTQICHTTLFCNHVTWKSIQHVYEDSRLTSAVTYRPQIINSAGEIANARSSFDVMRFDNAAAPIYPVVSNITTSAAIMNTYKGVATTPYDGLLKTGMECYIQSKIATAADNDDIVGDNTGDAREVTIRTIPKINELPAGTSSPNVGDFGTQESIEHGMIMPATADREDNINIVGDGDAGRLKLRAIRNKDPLLSKADFSEFETQISGQNSFEHENTTIAIKNDEYDVDILGHCDTREIIFQAIANINGQPITSFLADIHRHDLETVIGHATVTSISAATDEDKMKFIAHFGVKPENIAEILRYYDNFRLEPDENLELYRRYDTNVDVYDTLWNLCETGNLFMDMKQCEICRKWGPHEGYVVHYILAHARTYFDEIYQDKLI